MQMNSSFIVTVRFLKKHSFQYVTVKNIINVTKYFDFT